MKTIIEKLGITPGQMKSAGLEEGAHVVAIDDVSILSVHYEYDAHTGEKKPWGIIPNGKDADLFAAAPEMLEALIEMLIETQILYNQFCRADFESVFLDKIKTVEKATGKTWDEMKELYETN